MQQKAKQKKLNRIQNKKICLCLGAIFLILALTMYGLLHNFTNLALFSNIQNKFSLYLEVQAKFSDWLSKFFFRNFFKNYLVDSLWFMSFLFFTKSISDSTFVCFFVFLTATFTESLQYFFPKLGTFDIFDLLVYFALTLITAFLFPLLAYRNT